MSKRYTQRETGDGNVRINHEKGNGKLDPEDDSKEMRDIIHLSCHHHLAPKYRGIINHLLEQSRLDEGKKIQRRL